jgi:DNA polymerase I-like protein with 3'-5' exonuclease and polymerase domains
MYKLPAMYVGSYAEKDAELTYKLWQELKKEIEHQDIHNIWKLETELFPALVDMRFLGVRVNQEQAAIEKKTLVEQEKKLLHEVGITTNVDVQIWAARSIAQSL